MAFALKLPTKFDMPNKETKPKQIKTNLLFCILFHDDFIKITVRIPCGVVGNVMDCDFVISEFKL